MANERPIQAVFFDLDGTLLDTAKDLLVALNKVLTRHQKSTLTLSEVRPAVSHGGRALIKLGFGIDENASEFEDLRQEFLMNYRQQIHHHTVLFPQMDSLLSTLEQWQLPWGIVTNKPGWLTNPLLESLKLTSRAACIVSGDTTAHAKPHAEPLIYACQMVQKNPQHCIYIGDHKRDIDAAKAAGMKSLVALYGYIDDDPYRWQADGYIHSPMQAIQWLDTNG